MLALRCASLVLLHALALADVNSMNPTVNPRGWRAAKEAERRARRVPPARQAADAAPAAAAVDLPPAAAALPPAPAAPQQTCSSLRRPELEAQQAARQAQATTAAAAFLLGMLCGMLLLAGLQRWRRWRSRAVLAGPEGQLSAAASCAVPGGAVQREQQHLHPAGPTDATAKVKLSASNKPGVGPKVTKEAAEADSRPHAAVPAAAAAAGAAGEEGVGESPGAEVAVAAAVCELMLQTSSEASASNDGGQGVTAAVAAVASPQQHHHHHQQQQQQAQHEEMLLAVAAVGGSTGGAATAGTLGTLWSEEHADVAAAAQLVLTMCSTMHVDPGQLSQGERLQLIYTMLQAWQAQQARRHTEQMHQLGSEANVLRGQQRDIAAHQAARQAARDAYRLSLQRTADFRRMCSDTLTFGLAVMVATGTYQLMSRGLLASITASCGSVSSALGGRWGLWSTWRAGEAVLCYVTSIGDALVGLGVLLGAPWLVYRSGLMSDYHTMPVSKLFIGLGLICGLSGFLAVGKLGGSRSTWLAAWEAWVVLHIALSAAAHRMQRVRLRAQPGAAGAGRAGAAAAADSLYEHGGGWLPAVMWVALGLVLPTLAGTLPFMP